MQNSNFRVTLFIYLGFILIIPIGTITHELGHYFSAEYLDYNPTLHYNRVSTKETSKQKRVSQIFRERKYELEKKNKFKDEALYLKLRKELVTEEIIILLGGMFSTYILGSLGLLILVSRNRNKTCSIINFIGLFLSLFWLRPVFNLGFSLSTYIFGMSSYPFLGDELRASMAFGLNQGTLSVLFASIGTLVTFTTIILSVSKHFYLRFVFFGGLGALSGYFLWFKLFGPLILP